MTFSHFIRVFFFSFFIYCIPLQLLAVDKISIDINSIFLLTNQHQGNSSSLNKVPSLWLMNNVSAYIEFPFSDKQQLVFKIEEIQLSLDPLLPSESKIFKLQLKCQDFELSVSKISCLSGQIEIKNRHRQDLNLSSKLSFVYDIVLQKLVLKVNRYSFAGAKGDLTLKYQNKYWSIDSTLNKLDLVKINQWFNLFLPDNHILDKSTGKISLHLNMSGGEDGWFFINLKMQAKNLNLELQQSDLQDYLQGSAEVLTENLNFDFDLVVGRGNRNLKYKDKDKYDITVKLKNTAGAIFVAPYYIELNGLEKAFLKVNTDLSERLKIKNFNLSIGSFFSLKSKATYQLKDQQFLNYNISLQSNNLKLFQEKYLDNLLSGTLLEGLQISGNSQIKLVMKDKISHLNLDLKNLDLALAENNINKLNTQLFWLETENLEINKNIIEDVFSVKVSHLSWEKINFKKLKVGKTAFNFQAQNNKFKVEKEIKIPVFDGTLIVKNLRLGNIFKDFELSFDGVLEPVSMSLISEQLDWPKLHGKLSALIPHTTYTEKKLYLGGKLWFNLFDGQFALDEISIFDPLTDYSRLKGNILLNNINLSPLTKTFDFGNMQGRVGGYFNNLVLENWEPVSFDMYIGTEKGDNSRHTISQRAVDNLSSLGGMSGVLSKGFMSFFENFHYQKLGIGCHLDNGRCTMRGVEKDKNRNAYYIVKGGGIPRIDIMGYETNVDWNTLLERLQSIQQSNQEVIIE